MLVEISSLMQKGKKPSTVIHLGHYRGPLLACHEKNESLCLNIGPEMNKVGRYRVPMSPTLCRILRCVRHVNRVQTYPWVAVTFYPRECQSPEDWVGLHCTYCLSPPS